MAKSSFRSDPDPAPPEYPDLDRGRRACLARLGAAGGAILLALGATAEAGEPSKKEKEKGKKKKDDKKKRPVLPPPGVPPQPRSQLDELLD